jgi:hypothetical protein
MNSVRNQKLLVILLAGMAMGISSFGSTGKFGRADFSSYDDADDSGDGGESMAAPGDIDQVVDQVRGANENAKTGPIAIIDDGKNEVTADATKEKDGYSAEVVANSGKENEARTTVHAKNDRDLHRKIRSAQEKVLTRSKTIKERADLRKKDKKEIKNKIANCELEKDGKTEIDATDVDSKLSCFNERAKGMNEKEKKAFLSKTVTPYVQNLENNAIKGLTMNDPTGANAAASRASLMELQQTLAQNGLIAPFAGELNVAIQAANYRAMPAQQSLTQNWIMNRAAMQIAANPNMSAQQKAQLQQSVQAALTQSSFSAVQQDLGMRSALVNGMSGVHNPMVAQAIGFTVNGLSQDVQRQMAANTNVNKAFSGLINPMGSTFNTLGSLGGDPVLASIFGNSLATAFAPDNVSSFDMNSSFWSQTPNNGSNMANPTLANPAFVPATPLTNTKTAALKPLTLTR